MVRERGGEGERKSACGCVQRRSRRSCWPGGGVSASQTAQPPPRGWACAMRACVASTLGRTHGLPGPRGRAQIGHLKRKRKNAPLARAGRLGSRVAAPTVAAAPRTAARRDGAMGASSAPAMAATLTAGRRLAGRADRALRGREGGRRVSVVDRAERVQRGEARERDSRNPLFSPGTRQQVAPGRPEPRCGWSAWRESRA